MRLLRATSLGSTSCVSLRSNQLSERTEMHSNRSPPPLVVFVFEA